VGIGAGKALKTHASPSEKKKKTFHLSSPLLINVLGKTINFIRTRQDLEKGKGVTLAGERRCVGKKSGTNDQHIGRVGKKKVPCQPEKSTAPNE